MVKCRDSWHWLSIENNYSKDYGFERMGYNKKYLYGCLGLQLIHLLHLFVTRFIY